MQLSRTLAWMGANIKTKLTPGWKNWSRFPGNERAPARVHEFIFSISGSWRPAGCFSTINSAARRPVVNIVRGKAVYEALGTSPKALLFYLPSVPPFSFFFLSIVRTVSSTCFSVNRFKITPDKSFLLFFK